MLEVPERDVRCCWALMSSLIEVVRNYSVIISDAGSLLEGMQQNCLFNSGGGLYTLPAPRRSDPLTWPDHSLLGASGSIASSVIVQSQSGPLTASGRLQVGSSQPGWSQLPTKCVYYFRTFQLHYIFLPPIK